MKKLGRPEIPERKRKMTVAYCLSKHNIEFISNLALRSSTTRSKALDGILEKIAEQNRMAAESKL